MLVMKNSQFKLSCLKNGLYTPKQFIDFYNIIFPQNLKFNRRDAQLWFNGKNDEEYKIDESAIYVINNLNNIRNKIIEEELKRINEGEERYKFIFKTDSLLWETYSEFVNLPVNFFNSIMVELKKENVSYYEVKAEI